MTTAAPTTSHAPAQPSRNPLARFDGLLDRMIGCDMRLIYGVGMPMLLVCAVIVALAFSPSVWLVAVTIILEFACLGFIVMKLMAMLGEGEEADA